MNIALVGYPMNLSFVSVNQLCCCYVRYLDTQVFKEMEADLLANPGSAHEFYGPEPALPIAKSVVKKSIRDWVKESEELYGEVISMPNTPIIIEVIQNFDIPLLSFERSLISNLLSY